MTALLAIVAVVLDALLGEPRRWHPLVGFGRLARRLEGMLIERLGVVGKPLLARAVGLAALVALVTPPTALAALTAMVPGAPVSDALWLYLALGARSLADHAYAVAAPLAAGDLNSARRRVARLVSRDTADMNPDDVSRAAVESVLENGSDAVFATLFWFAIAGAPGVVAHRLVNTLDAMWGYRTPRYVHFGWGAARLDDAMNWVPARLTALTYAALGGTRAALSCWRAQARHWYSPNAGPVMASGAGALGIALGGPARYHGALKMRPALGVGPAPVAHDIARAVRLVRAGIALWLAALAALDGARWAFG